jgi:hypothetical protein
LYLACDAENQDCNGGAGCEQAEQEARDPGARRIGAILRSRNLSSVLADAFSRSLYKDPWTAIARKKTGMMVAAVA